MLCRRGKSWQVTFKNRASQKIYLAQEGGNNRRPVQIVGRGVSFHDLCVSPNITGAVMISRRMRWAGRCQVRGEEKC